MTNITNRLTYFLKFTIYLYIVGLQHKTYARCPWPLTRVRTSWRETSSWLSSSLDDIYDSHSRVIKTKWKVTILGVSHWILDRNPSLSMSREIHTCSRTFWSGIGTICYDDLRLTQSELEHQSPQKTTIALPNILSLQRTFNERYLFIIF